jgi:short-subunit dehydrogenase
MEMKGFFKGKTVVVTGASSGIGWALSLELANRGALVIAAARRKEKLEELASHSPLMILPFVCDITIDSNCADLMTFADNQMYPLCGLINNAGIGMRALFHELEMDVFHRVMEVNFGGTVRCTRYALPSLIKNRGWLVGVSSVAGYIGLPGRSGYSASKFAMQGFLEVIRSENRRKGLHVLVACPGFTKSEIRKQALNKNGQIQEDSPRKEQKLMTAEFVAQQIVDAMEKRKDELIIGKQGKVAVWFKKFFPYFTEILTYRNMAKEPGAPLN